MFILDNILLVVIICLVFLIIALFIFGRYYLWPRRHQTYSWIFARRNHRKLGNPCRVDIILDRGGYSLGFSKKMKSALWASYIISEGSVNIDVDRGTNFYADPDIPKQYRVDPDDYRHSGYDKGHLAPSATIDFSRQSNDETFAMTNIVPQHPHLNRHGWRKLEDIIRDWTETKGRLAVVTGPIYSKRPRRKNDVPIPKAFYKVVYAFDYEASIGFIFPNQSVPSNRVWEYVTTVKAVEKETGYRFFSKLGRKGSRIKTKLNAPWWQRS